MGVRRAWGCLATLFAIGTFFACLFAPFIWASRLLDLPHTVGFPLNLLFSVGLIVLFFGLFPIAGEVRRALRDLPAALTLRLGGRIADGRVTNLADAGGNDGDPHGPRASVFIIKPGYRVDDVDVTANDQLVHGSKVRVRYHRNQPLAKLVRPPTARRLGHLAPGLLLVAAVILGWVALSGPWWTRTRPAPPTASRQLKINTTARNSSDKRAGRQQLPRSRV